MGFGLKKKEFAKIKTGKDGKGIEFVKGKDSMFDVSENVKKLKLDGTR